MKPSAEAPVDLQTAFKEAMAQVCTPVSVVTTLSGGVPHGTTVSAFMSLSMDPPMAAVSLDRNSALLSKLRDSQMFGLNIMGEGQDAVALNFARKADAKFDGIDWTPHAGVPRLAGVGVFVACTVVDIVRGGDHFIVLGAVTDVAAEAGKPLTYHARSFGTHTPARATAS